MIRACRIKLNPRPLGVVHPLGLVIRQEYLARACSRTNYQAVSLVCPHPHSPRKWGASSKMHVNGRDSGAKEGQEWSHLDMINTETELNLSDTTGQCCKLQQASAHLHQVIEEGVLPTHILQSADVCLKGMHVERPYWPYTLFDNWYLKSTPSQPGREKRFYSNPVSSMHYSFGEWMQIDKTHSNEGNIFNKVTDNTCTALRLIIHQWC